MQHTNRSGASKLLSKLTLPVTGLGCVKKIVTNLCVIDVTSRGFELKELAPGISINDVQNATEGNLIVDGEIPKIKF
jgi:3-oxoacid CoA-transferase subunit B